MERLAAIPDRKSKLNWHIDYYKKQIERLNIEVKLNTKATFEAIKELNPYAVFVATGTEEIFPESIQGIDNQNVISVRDVLNNLPDIVGKYCCCRRRNDRT